MNTSVFCVEQGEHSDYKIVGVFSTPEKTQQLINKMKVDYAAENEGEEMYGSRAPRIVERKIDPYVEELNQGLTIWTVLMERNAKVRYVSKVGVDAVFDIHNVYKEPQIDAETKYDPVRKVHAYVFAKNEKHAIKIMNEKRVALIAEGLL